MQNIASEFGKSITGLKGLKCAGVFGTVGVGSMITLLFGRTHIESIELVGQKADFETSDISLSLEWAAWRIQSTEELLCSSTSENGIGGEMERGASVLKGKAVKNVLLRQGSFDVTLWFDDGIRLSIFCDQVNRTNGRRNYQLRYHGVVFLIGPFSQLTCENLRGRS